MGTGTVLRPPVRWVRYLIGTCEFLGVWSCETVHYRDDEPGERVAVIICRRGRTLWTHIVDPTQILGDADPPRSGDGDAEKAAQDHAEFFRRRDERCQRGGLPSCR